MKRALLFVLAALLAGCASLPVIGPAFDARDRWVYGTVVKIERNEDYEQPCRIWCKIFQGGGIDWPRAYDAQVADTTGKKINFMFFAPHGNVIPVVGQTGYWHLHPESVVRFSGCHNYGCPTDFVWQLHPDEDLDR